MSDLTESQKATNWETLKHIELVMQYLETMKHEIARRQFSHDRSKLESPEMEMFEQFTHRLRGMTYGSDEYKECLEEMKRSALGSHYENNRHHPEYFPERPKDKAIDGHLVMAKWAIENAQVLPDDIYGYEQLKTFLDRKQKEATAPINNMNLIDVLELICDWRAAVDRHADGDIYRSIEINTERFSLSPQLVQILKNTVPLLISIYTANTQKHLHEAPNETSETTTV